MDTGIDMAVVTPAPRSEDGTASVPAVVCIVGHLDDGTSGELTTRLAEMVRERGRLVADVSGLHPVDSSAVHAFADVLDLTDEWPVATLVLAAPDTALAALLVTSGVARRVPVFPDVPTAQARIDERPQMVRSYWSFTVSTRAPGSARGHIRRVCERWDLEDAVCEAAEIVATELVTNAVEHAGSESVLAVERTEGSFRLTVRDYDHTVLPDSALPPPESARGRGLGMVAAVARSWGVRPDPEGKTVWVEMATP